MLEIGEGLIAVYSRQDCRLIVIPSLEALVRIDSGAFLYFTILSGHNGSETFHCGFGIRAASSVGAPQEAFPGAIPAPVPGNLNREALLPVPTRISLLLQIPAQAA